MKLSFKVVISVIVFTGVLSSAFASELPESQVAQTYKSMKAVVQTGRNQFLGALGFFPKFPDCPNVEQILARDSDSLVELFLRTGGY